MKKSRIVSICAAACLLLAGCGNEIPAMSEQQQNVVTEYAAGIALKYSANYNDRLFRKEPEEQEAVQEEASEAQLPDDSAEETSGDQAQQQPDLSDVPVIGGKETDASQSAGGMSLEEVLAQSPNFRITYEKYEILDAYSGDDDDTVAFEMTASPGKKLLVLQFRVENVSGQEQAFEVYKQNLKVRVAAAGKTQNALLTMLDNDLLTANSVMQPEESGTYVIITQIDEGSAVEEIHLTITNEENSAQYQY